MSEEYAKTLIGEVVEKLKEAEVKIEDIWEALLHHTKKVAAENVVGNSGTPATSADAAGTVSTSVTPDIESGGADPNSAPEAPTVTPISVEPVAGVEPSTVEPPTGQ